MMFARPLAVVVMLVGSFACSRPAETTSARLVESERRERTREVEASFGAVVCVEAQAARIGASVLENGGNAIDAAVATAFALAVTWPEAGNLGGGGFMLVRPAQGDAGFVDYRETAPGRATPTMFLKADGSIDHDAIDHGWLGVGVPGTVAGLFAAHQRYGTKPWAELVEPAARLARDGIEVSPALAASIANARDLLALNDESARIWLRADGSPHGVGDRVMLPELADTLEAIAAGGARAFYEGEIARRIVEDSRAHGGIHTLEDFSSYRAVFREPLRGTYRGHDLLVAPPPSSGGVILLSALRQLEALAEIDPAPPPSLGSAREVHRHAEVLKRAFLDRYRFLGDSDFVEVDVARLISEDHARELARTIDPRRATPAGDLAGDLDGTLPGEGEHTTHFSVVDAQGNAVSNTYTLEQSWGSKITAKGTGILMNDEMGDFNAKPGESTTRGRIGTAPNLVAPGKRMLSSMCPVIVTKGGELTLVAGSPGGRTIPSTVLRIVTAIVDHGLDPTAAVALPRVHHALFPDVLRVEESLADLEIESLRASGHSIERVAKQGDAHVIGRRGTRRIAIPDHRIDGAAEAPRSPRR